MASFQTGDQLILDIHLLLVSDKQDLILIRLATVHAQWFVASDSSIHCCCSFGAATFHSLPFFLAIHSLLTHSLLSSSSSFIESSFLAIHSLLTHSLLSSSSSFIESSFFLAIHSLLTHSLLSSSPSFIESSFFLTIRSFQLLTGSVVVIVIVIH